MAHSPPEFPLDSNHRYRQIVEHSPNAVFSIDKQDCITSWNRACETLLGYGSALLGQAYQTLIIGEEQRQRVADQVARVFQGETFAEVTLILRCQAGANRVFMSRLYPLFDDLGIGECAFVNTDVTERQQADDLLRASEERYRRLFEQAMDGIIILDEYGYFTEANSRFARMLGYTPNDLLHLNLTEVIPLEDQLRLSQLLNDLFRADELSFELRFRHRNGAPVDTEISAQLIDSEHIQWIIRDVSRRKKTERDAFDLAVERERVRVLGDFVRNASHEFRTPLSVINTSLYLLDRLESSEQKQRQTAKIAEQVANITTLVEDLLTMSRLDSNPQFEFATLDLNTLVQTVKKSLDTSIQEKGHQVSLELEPQPLLVWGDVEKLHIAVGNILYNALRFTPPGGRVWVRTRRENAHAVTEIQDTGIGIRPSELRRIFESFYRGDTAHSTRGFGLGLPIAQKIVDGHQGRIDVESEVGVGSTFRIRLPLALSAL